MNKQGILSNPKKMLLLNSRQTSYLSGGCLNQADATQREKHLKIYNGRRFLHNRLKSYLTGVS